MEVNKVKHAIYCYGILPALVMLKNEQLKENYDNCKIIKEALDEVGLNTDWYKGSSVDEESFNNLYQEIYIQAHPAIALSLPEYIEKFYELLT